MKQYFKGVRKSVRDAITRWLGSRRMQPSRTYSLGGWVRGEDGFYRNPDFSYPIYKAGGVWIRDVATSQDGGGVTLLPVSFPTLRAAIKGEVIPIPDPVPTAPLFERVAGYTKPDCFGSDDTYPSVD